MNDLFEQGGWTLIIIVALSVWAWYLIVAKWSELRQEATGLTDWLPRTLEDVEGEGAEPAWPSCPDREALAGRLLDEGLRLGGPSSRRFVRRMPTWRESAVDALRRHLDVIATLAAASPLLGLLGTVLGMVKTFGALTRQGVVEIDDLTEGISQALVTTQAGLLVALPILVAHRALDRRLQRLDATTEITLHTWQRLSRGDS